MAAKLLVVGGPLRNSQFPLGNDVAIGRDVDSTIRLDDPAVSPRHCTITSQDGQLILCDLDSHAGTFVNGIPVKQRTLKSGDEIAVGVSVFRFEAEEPQNPRSSRVQLSERETLNAKVLEFHAGELLSLPPQSLAALPQPARMARNLSALLQICKAIGSLRDEEALPWVLLGMIFDVIPAERGAILLMQEDSNEIRSQVAWDRLLGPEHPVHISGEIVRQVIEEGISLLDGGSATEDSAGSPVSDEKAPRAFLCVPMMSGKKAIGLIYLESSNDATSFTKDDFQLLVC